MDAPTSSPALRYAVPDRLRASAGSLACWLRRVALPQFVVGASTALIASCVVVGGRMPIAVALVPVLLGILAAGQAVLLLSVATDLLHLGGDAERAHQHLRRAFVRLRGAVVVDLVLVTVALGRNLVAGVVA